MSIFNRITLYEKSISKRKVNTKCLYEKSISNRNVYTRSLYLTEKTIRLKSIPKSLYITKNSTREVYI